MPRRSGPGESREGWSSCGQARPGICRWPRSWVRSSTLRVGRGPRPYPGSRHTPPWAHPSRREGSRPSWAKTSLAVGPLPTGDRVPQAGVPRPTDQARQRVPRWRRQVAGAITVEAGMETTTGHGAAIQPLPGWIRRGFGSRLAPVAGRAAPACAAWRWHEADRVSRARALLRGRGARVAPRAGSRCPDV